MIETLTKRSEFVKAAQGGFKCVTHSMVLQIRTNTESGQIRVGYTATKKLGNAVIRNRAKRRLRAVANEILPHKGRSGHDYVLIARKLAVECPYDRLKKDLTYALKRAHNA